MNLRKTFGKKTEANPEMALRQTEERFRMLIEQAVDGIFHGDQKGNFIGVNSQACVLTGYSMEELIGMNMADLFTREEREREPLRYDLLNQGQTLTRERKLLRKDGELRVIEMHTKRMPDGTYQSIFRDITSRWETDRKLVESEAKFRTLFTAAHDAIFIMHQDVFIDCNPATLKLFGCEYEDIVGRQPYAFSPEMQPDGRNSLEKARELINRAMSGMPLFFEWVHRKKSGEDFYAEVSLNRYEYANDYYLQAIVRDISARKAAEENMLKLNAELEQNEERYRLISRVTSDYMFSTMLMPDGRLSLTWVAGAFERITGYTMDEYKAMGGWRAALHPDDLWIDQRDMERLYNGQQVVTEIRTLKKSGDVVWVRVYAHPLWDEKEECLKGIYGAVQDINEQKKAEAELKELNTHLNDMVKERTRELEVLNQTKDKFFSIIAHDLKGPVSAIIGSAEMLIRTIQDQPQNHERLLKYSENIMHSTLEGHKLLENLLDWARSQTGTIQNQPEMTDLKECWQEAIASMRLLILEKEVSISLSDSPSPVFADRNMVRTIVRNLLSNSVKYSHKGGSINISLTNRDGLQHCEITDTGVGMSEETLADLFRIDRKTSLPGTFKERGTGLGLILCREFVEQCGGSLTVRSSEGAGSTFTFTLPLSKA